MEKENCLKTRSRIQNAKNKSQRQIVVTRRRPNSPWAAPMSLLEIFLDGAHPCRHGKGGPFILGYHSWVPHLWFVRWVLVGSVLFRIPEEFSALQNHFVHRQRNHPAQPRHVRRRIIRVASEARHQPWHVVGNHAKRYEGKS